MKGPFWPHRQFPKTGTIWGSRPVSIVGDWIAIFSYTENKQHSEGSLFVDVYDHRLGHKLMSTTLPIRFPPNESFKGATGIEGNYLLLPLNAPLDSFALWQLP